MSGAAHSGIVVGSANGGSPNVTIENNIIQNVTGNQSNGIEVVAGSNNLTIKNNKISGNWRGIYLNPASGVSITGNLIDANNGVGVGIGSSGQSNMTVTGNIISNHTVEGWGIDTVGSNVVAHNNSFTGNTAGLDWYSGSAIDATNNWWGSASGPGGSGLGIGNSVSSNINFSLWCSDATCTKFVSKPTVTGVTSDGTKYNLASGSSANIQVTFDQNISNIPTITVNSAPLTVSSCVDSKTFCFTYAIPASTDGTTESVSISGATGTLGNQTMNPVTTGHTFVVDTVAPSIRSITSDATADTALKINGTITFTLTLNTATDHPASVVNSSYNGEAISFSSSDGITYTGTYTVLSGQSDHSSPLQITGVTVTDGAGNVSAAAAGTDIQKTIDANSPTLSLVSIASNNAVATRARTGDLVVLVFTSNENVGTPTVTIDGKPADSVTGGPTSWQATYTFTGSETQGAIPFAIQFSDIAGNAGTAVTTTGDASSVTYDKTAPTIIGISTTNADGPYRAGQVITFTVTFSEPMKVTGTPTLALNYNSDHASYSSGSGGTTLTFTYTVQAGDTFTGLKYNGTGSLALNGGTITDLAGNNTVLLLPNPSTFSHFINLDTTAPVVAEDTHVTSPTNANTYTYKFHSDEAGTVVYGGSCSGTAGGAVSAGTTTVALTHLADGTYSNCTVTVTDAAGNASNVLGITAFTVDTTGPVATSVTTSDADGIIKSGAVVTITATFNENVADGTPTIQLSGANVASPVAMTKTDAQHYTYQYTAGAGNGAVNISVFGSADGLGNVQSVPGTATLTLDNTAPTIDAHGDISSNEATGSSGRVVTYTSPNAHDAVSGIFAATCSPTSGSIFALGTTTVTCNATDTAGNAATPTTFGVGVVDTTPPTITLTGTNPMSILKGNTYTELGATASDLVDGSFAATVSGTVDTNTAGAYVVHYNAHDVAGNATTTLSRTVNVSATDLSVTPSAPGGDGSSTGMLTNAASSTVSSGGTDMTVTIPADTEVTGGPGWDGAIGLPTVTTSYTSPTPDSNTTVSVKLALEVGSSTSVLTFDKGVRLFFEGQSGSRIGWTRNGGAFTEITDTCSTDSQAVGDALDPGTDCKKVVGSDLVVWTKHFTTFVTYTQTATPAAVSSGGGGGIVGLIGGNAGPAAVALANNGGAAPSTTGNTTGTTASTGSTASTGGQVLGAATFNFTANLTVGSRGNDVTELQKALIAAGNLSVATPTTYFGALTKAAVIKYQKAHGITPASGYVGSLTRASLNAGVTPTMSDEQRSIIIKGLQDQLQVLLAKLKAITG